MRHLHTIGLLLACRAIALGQFTTVAVPTTPHTVAFYSYLFKTVADPALSPAAMERRERMAASRFGMNASEASALHLAAMRYTSSLIGFNNAISDIASSKTFLTPDDRSKIASVDSQRLQMIMQLAVAFAQQLTPQTASRIAHLMNMEVPR